MWFRISLVDEERGQAVVDAYHSIDPPEIPQVPSVDPTLAVELEMPSRFSDHSAEIKRTFYFVELPIISAGGIALAQIEIAVGVPILVVPIAAFAILQTKPRYAIHLVVIVGIALVLWPHFVAYATPILIAALFAECLGESYLHYATGAPLPLNRCNELRSRLSDRGVLSSLASVVFGGGASTYRTFHDALAIWLTYDPEEGAGVLPARFGSKSNRMLILSITLICLGSLFSSPVFMLPATIVSESIQDWLVSQIGPDGRPPGVSRGMNLLLGSIFILPLPIAFLMWFSNRYASSLLLAAENALQEVRHISSEDRHAAMIDRLDQSPRHKLHVVGLGPVSLTANVLPIEVYSELSWLYGPMGSGKTTALNQLAERLIAFGISVSYIDLKGGSNEVAETLRVACEKHGVPLKAVNPSAPASHVLNPFKMKSWGSLTLSEQVETILRMLGASHDRAAWGKGYYTTANETLVQLALTASPDISTFGELSQALSLAARSKSTAVPQSLLRDGSHVVGAVRRFADLEILNATERTHSQDIMDAAIDFAAPFRAQEVHFYQLPVARLGSHAAELARLVCNGYPSSAEQVPAKKRRQMVVIVDEFHCLDSGEGKTLESFLTQSRSLDIGVVLANQTPGQITNPLIAANVMNGTRFRQCFGLGPSDMLAFEASSGRRIEELRAQAVRDDGISLTISDQLTETIQPHINVNQLRQVTADPTLSICELVRGTTSFPSDGMPYINRSMFNIDEQEYKRRKNAPWPILPGMIIRSEPFDPNRRPER